MSIQAWLQVAVALLGISCIANAWALVLVTKWQRQHIDLFHRAPRRLAAEAGITVDAHTEEKP